MMERKTATMARLSAVVLVSIFSMTSAVNQRVVDNARAAIFQVIKAGAQSPSSVNLHAKFVRLAFHDCVGGCDGCVDMSNPDNAGLDVPIDALAPICSTFASQGLSRADIWALAGLVGAKEAQPPTATDNRVFRLEKTGRPTCQGGNAKGGPSQTMPSSNGNTDHVLEFFSSNFGFQPKEVR